MRIGSRGAAPGRMVFMDVADQEGLGQVSLDFVKWGTSFFDYDNDGRPDLLSVNGSTFEDPKDTRKLIAMRHHLFWNHGDRDGFFDVAPVAGAPFTEASVGRGAAFADYDQDGGVDVLVVNNGANARLLRNDGGNRRHWLEVRARGTRNPQGLGAIVIVEAGGRIARQQVGSQPSYISQSSSTMHFGLGDAARADTVRVRFTGGREVVQQDVPANQLITVVEPR
jgi:hypothetical protein